MSKAFLIFDEMPNDCAECPVHDFDDIGCVPLKRVIYCGIGKNKPDWCPMKPMPNYDCRDVANQSEVDYQLGWNDAIRAIGGYNN